MYGPRDAFGNEGSPVYVIDVQIPFWSLVALWVKAALAAIPAALVLGLAVAAWKFLTGMVHIPN